MPSIPVPQKRRGRPATGVSPRVGVRLDQEIVDGISAFQADEDPPIENQSEAIRRILRDWLIGHGYLKGLPQQGTRPEDLDASNDD